MLKKAVAVSIPYYYSAEALKCSGTIIIFLNNFVTHPTGHTDTHSIKTLSLTQTPNKHWLEWKYHAVALAAKNNNNHYRE